MLLPQIFLHILIKSLPKHDNLQTLCSKYIKFPLNLSTPFQNLAKITNSSSQSNPHVSRVGGDTNSSAFR